MKKILAIATIATIIFVLVGASGQTTSAQQPTAAATASGTGPVCAAVASNPAPGSPEANKALACRYVEQVVNEGKYDVLDELTTPNYKRYLSPTAAPLDLAGQKKRLAGLAAAFPDVQLMVDDMIAEGDRVAFRTTIRATHKGVLSGIQPTGKQITVTELEILHFENGKIAEQWGGPDMWSLLQQIGATIK